MALVSFSSTNGFVTIYIVWEIDVFARCAQQIEPIKAEGEGRLGRDDRLG